MCVLSERLSRLPDSRFKFGELLLLLAFAARNHLDPDVLPRRNLMQKIVSIPLALDSIRS